MTPEPGLRDARHKLRDALGVDDLSGAVAVVLDHLDRRELADDEGPVAVGMAHELAVAAGAAEAGSAPEWDDPAALAGLGRALLRLRLPTVAATFLLRAHDLAPEDREIGLAATSALLTAGDPADARIVADAAGLAGGTDVGELYLAAFAALASGDVAASERIAGRLPAVVEPPEAALAERLREMHARARLLLGAGRANPDDLRGWQFVLTGGLLLERSPHGEEMHGRYGYLRDSVERLRRGIGLAAHVLRRAGVDVPRVVAADDEDSRVLAGAVARVLSVPLVSPAAEPDDAPGLVVVYDVAGLPAEAVRGLRRHRPGRRLWTHAASWTREEPVAGDLTTTLSQVQRPQWRDDGGPAPIDVEVWVERIAGAEAPDPGDDGADLDALLDVVLGAGPASRPALLRDDGLRLPQWAASPVTSLRFR